MSTYLKNKKFCDKRETLEDVSDNRYQNLNLNQNRNFLIEPSNNACGINKHTNNAQVGYFDYGNSERKGKPWNQKKSFERFSNVPNLFADNQQSFNGTKLEKSLNKNYNNTLSLHIAAYEKSVENSDAQLEYGNQSKHFKSSIEKVAFGSLVGGTAMVEFARNNDEQNTVPEVMQFKASQRLFNPYSLNSNEKKTGSLFQDGFVFIICTFFFDQTLMLMEEKVISGNIKFI